MKKIIKKIVGTVLQGVFSVFPVQKNKIMFETCTGEAKDHVRALYDYMKENGIDDYRFVWAIKKGADVSGIPANEIAYKKTIGYYYHLMTSKYWMRTHSVENIVKKREQQIYIQLWHGPGATKKEGFDLHTIENHGQVMPHAREWDYYIATDVDSREYIKTALNLKIPRLMLGSCRSDRLVNADPERYKKLREELGIKSSETVVLYAPTFREEDFNLQKISLKVKQLAKTEGVRLILRLHPEVKNRIDMSEYDSSVIDGNVFPDIFDLYLVSDILITDYSSVSIEYSILKKPILYYMYDLEEYKKERDFYFDYLNHLSGPVLKTEEELIDAVTHIVEYMERYQDKYNEYYNKYNAMNDGHVCERVCKLLQSGFFDTRGNELNEER